ncbi:hypothetical protein MY11210_005365 [Beauveria gryllotalpidicola]
MFIKSIAVSGLVTAATAHIIMTNPVPYGLSSLSNSPLKKNGADFPCKQRTGVYDAEGASNVYAQGSTQQLEFQGGVVHAGGSCQVSVTTDLEPTKNSVWKVIKSIEGGCPARGEAGNLGTEAKAPVPYKYDFTIPNELAAGNYTLAWSWFNKLGQREMYMNCAPLAVTGNAGSEGFLNGLPDMMVANVGTGCDTPAEGDILFPDPGKDVDLLNGNTDAFTSPVGACGKTATGGSVPTSAPGGGVNPESTASATAPVQPTSAQPSPSLPTSGGSAPGDGVNPESTTSATTPVQPTSARPSPSLPTSGGSAPSSSLPGGIFITSSASQPTPTQPSPSLPTSGGSAPGDEVNAESTTSATTAVQPTSAQPSPSLPTSSGCAPGSSLPGGIFVTSPESQPTTPTQATDVGISTIPAQSSSKPAPTSATVPTPVSPGLPPTATGGPVPGNPPSPSGGYAPGTACSSEGLWNCIDGKSFQRCGSGKWSASQAVALGMSCQVGESTGMKVAGAAGIKRAMRRGLRIRH